MDEVNEKRFEKVSRAAAHTNSKNSTPEQALELALYDIRRGNVPKPDRVMVLSISTQSDGQLELTQFYGGEWTTSDRYNILQRVCFRLMQRILGDV